MTRSPSTSAARPGSATSSSTPDPRRTGYFSDGSASDAAPASYRLEVSRDGHTWTTVRTAHGTGQLTTMKVPHSPIRYVRATLTADAPQPWTIAEVRVYR